MVLTKLNLGKIPMLILTGGAYVSPSWAGHFEILLDRIKNIHASLPGHLGVLVLAYTLAPEGRYPLQLKQAMAGLNHVVKTERIAPPNVSLESPKLQSNYSVRKMGQLMKR